VAPVILELYSTLHGAEVGGIEKKYIRLDA